MPPVRACSEPINNAEDPEHWPGKNPEGICGNLNTDFTPDPVNPGFFFAKNTPDMEVRTIIFGKSRGGRTKGTFSGLGLRGPTLSHPPT